jgi:hypothetical protein
LLSILIVGDSYDRRSVALVSFDPARRLAWSEPRHGLAIDLGESRI